MTFPTQKMFAGQELCPSKWRVSSSWSLLISLFCAKPYRPLTILFAVVVLVFLCRYEILSHQIRMSQVVFLGYASQTRNREETVFQSRCIQFNESSFSSTQTRPKFTKPGDPRVAVCLVGGARAFELTGPSIKKYLLQANVNVDVFLHAPLDKNAYKFSILKDISRLVAVKIFSPVHIPETSIHNEVLTSNGSPNGIQGLLQYFKLVEGCLPLIEEYQQKYNFIYDWIVRSRVDSYWNKPLPSLESFNPEVYTIPYGSQFGGLNDRFGIGNWNTSKVALARLSALPFLHAHGLKTLNSERAFKHQIDLGCIRHEFAYFPFCVLSHRAYDWPPGVWGVPVVSFSSAGPLNGAKCRPCTPVVTGTIAEIMLNAQAKDWAWIGVQKEQELCNPQDDWEVNWEGIFDRAAGSEFSAGRKKMRRWKLADCEKANKEFRMRTEIWHAPPPRKICELGGFLS